MKKKLSATIEDDAYELLTNAAAATGLNLSEMLERSVRYACSEYLPHAIDVTLLDNGGCSVAFSMRGETFYARRAARRYAGVGVRASLRIESPSKIDLDLIAASLRDWQDAAARGARSGRPLNAKVRGVSLRLADLPILAESDPDFVRGVLHAAAEAIAAAEITSFGQVASRKCPSCGYFLVRLSVWSDPRDPRDREEREWVCGVGHKTTLRADVDSGATELPPVPGRAVAGDVRDAAVAFAEMGAWRGESPAELSEELAGARKRGGSRRVPSL
jgi:hypothetical protein